MVVNRQSLSDQIRRTLIEQIVSGKLKPGVRLVEMALAKSFQTSQTPVREALRDLEAMRMVEALPHRGVRVREVSEKEMAEAYATRGLLEEYAARLTTSRFAGDVANLREHAAGTKDAADRNDATAYAEHDFAFHRSIVEASGNATLLHLWDSLAFEFRTPWMLAKHPTNLAVAAAEHFLVLDAMLAGNGEAAGRLLRQHSESFIADSLRKEVLPS